MMRFVRNWDKWQSYRSDRGQPPWIKIHRNLMRNVDWVGLTDAQRGHLVCIWMLAADRNGMIPSCPKTLRKLCHLDEEPDLQVFEDAGFIVPDASLTPACNSNVTPARRQPDASLTPKIHKHDVPETEAETEAEADSQQEGGSSNYIASSGGGW